MNEALQTSKEKEGEAEAGLCVSKYIGISMTMCKAFPTTI